MKSAAHVDLKMAVAVLKTENESTVVAALAAVTSMEMGATQARVEAAVLVGRELAS